jgi:predicted RNA polymerase sigma factor
VRHAVTCLREAAGILDHSPSSYGYSLLHAERGKKLGWPPSARESSKPTGHRSSPCTTQLLAFAPTPVVALNHAIAIGEVQGAAAALALVDELDLSDYHPFHATRADLLRRLGRDSEAAVAYQQVAALAPTEAERDFLRLGGRASR